MAAYSRNRSQQGTTLHHSAFNRSLSPSGRFCSSSISSSTGRFYGSSVRSESRPDPVFARTTSPTRVSLGRPVSPSSSVSLSASRRYPIAASHHYHQPRRQQQQQQQSSPRRALNSGRKKTCMCSPTTHPGSFRCSLHKNSVTPGYMSGNQTSHQLNMRRSAMTNSLVRIGTVEGDLVKRALAALIRPSSHSLRRRADFRPRPSRLSIMTKAEDS